MGRGVSWRRGATLGQGFYTFAAQSLRQALPDNEIAQSIADEYERLSGEFDESRQRSRKYYDVDPEFANSFAGKLIGGAGAMVPQAVAAVIPGVGITALTAQSFQNAWDDAKQTAARNGEVFNPNKAFGYALSSSFIDALLQKAKIDNILGPWLRQGNGTKLIEWIRNIGRGGISNAILNPIQGAINDGFATKFGIEERDPFNLEKRGEESLEGLTLGAVASGVVGGTHAAAPLRENTPQLNIELGVRTQKKAENQPTRPTKDRILISKTIYQDIRSHVEKSASGLSNYTLSIVKARDWYNANLKSGIDLLMVKMETKGATLEEKAKAAFTMRNEFRQRGRDLMSDRKVAEKLAAHHTWEEIYNYYKGDYTAIIEGSKRSNEIVNTKVNKIRKKDIK